MSQTDDRIRRLIEDEIGACRDADVAERIDDLAELDDRTLADADVEGDVRRLSALANDTRYRIVRLLGAADGDLCVCEFDPLLDVSDSAISHALTRLADAGLVARRKEGKWRYYRTTERAERLLAVLDATRGDE